MNQISLKLYRTAAIAAFIFSTILIAFAIYNQFFYEDGTWVHGFTANSFIVLSGFIWMGILFVFKRFLNQFLNYSKANLLFYLYLIFLAISTLTLANVIFKTIQLYNSLENTVDFNAMLAFTNTSISGVIFIFIANYAIIFIAIVLGYRLSKVTIIEHQLFQALGYSFIVYGVVKFLTSITIIENDTFVFILNAIVSILIGLLFKKISGLSTQHLLQLSNNNNKKTKVTSTPSTQNTTSLNTQKEKEQPSKKRSFLKSKTPEVIVEQEELPSINLDTLSDKDVVISYHKNLPEEELKRLETIVERKYNQTLSTAQKHDLVLHYIVEKKLYDHQRFLPK